jgi:hypothetical protein
VLVLAQNIYAEDTFFQKTETVEAVVATALIQPDAIVGWKTNQVYFKPERIRFKGENCFICKGPVSIKIPFLEQDSEGFFVYCSKKEAEEHYNNAIKSGVEGAVSIAGGIVAAETGNFVVGAGSICVGAERLVDCGKELYKGWQEGKSDYSSSNENRGTMPDGPDRDK